MKTDTLVGITTIMLLCRMLPAAASDYTLGVMRCDKCHHDQHATFLHKHSTDVV